MTPCTGRMWRQEQTTKAVDASACELEFGHDGPCSYGPWMPSDFMPKATVHCKLRSPQATAPDHGAKEK